MDPVRLVFREDQDRVVTRGCAGLRLQPAREFLKLIGVGDDNTFQWRVARDFEDAIGNIGVTGHQHDWRQSRRGVGFQLAADLEAIYERHRHIEENDVWFLSVNGSQR